MTTVKVFCAGCSSSLRCTSINKLKTSEKCWSCDEYLNRYSHYYHCRKNKDCNKYNICPECAVIFSHRIKQNPPILNNGIQPIPRNKYGGDKLPHDWYQINSMTKCKIKFNRNIKSQKNIPKLDLSKIANINDIVVLNNDLIGEVIKLKYNIRLESVRYSIKLFRLTKIVSNVRLNQIKYFKEKHSNESNNLVIGDIILTKNNYIGRIAFISKSFPHIIFNRHYKNIEYGSLNDLFVGINRVSKIGENFWIEHKLPSGQIKKVEVKKYSTKQIRVFDGCYNYRKQCRKCWQCSVRESCVNKCNYVFGVGYIETLLKMKKTFRLPIGSKIMDSDRKFPMELFRMLNGCRDQNSYCTKFYHSSHCNRFPTEYINGRGKNHSTLDPQILYYMNEIINNSNILKDGYINIYLKNKWFKYYYMLLMNNNLKNGGLLYLFSNHIELKIKNIILLNINRNNNIKIWRQIPESRNDIKKGYFVKYGLNILLGESNDNLMMYFSSHNDREQFYHILVWIFFKNHTCITGTSDEINFLYPLNNTAYGNNLTLVKQLVRTQYLERCSCYFGYGGSLSWIKLDGIHPNITDSSILNSEYYSSPLHLNYFRNMRTRKFQINIGVSSNIYEQIYIECACQYFLESFSTKHAIRLNNVNIGTFALYCPILQRAFKDEKNITGNDLDHLHYKYHGTKNKCMNANNSTYECKLFDENEVHKLLYNHQPRRNKNININKSNLFVYQSDLLNTDPIKHYARLKNYNYSATDGNLNYLLHEHIKYGYFKILCQMKQFEFVWKPKKLDTIYKKLLKYNKNDITTFIINPNILTILKNKINHNMIHNRHKKMGFPLDRSLMTSIYLYTASDSCKDLTTSQINNNWNKWKYFDYNLSHAIKRLSLLERGEYPLYSGFTNVKLDKSVIYDIRLKTYTSSSYDKKVAQSFLGDSGLLIEWAPYMRKYSYKCCDVSWISEYPDEKEVLFARGVGHYSENGKSFSESSEKFRCDVINNGNIQHAIFSYVSKLNINNDVPLLTGASCSLEFTIF